MSINLEIDREEVVAEVQSWIDHFRSQNHKSGEASWQGVMDRLTGKSTETTDDNLEDWYWNCRRNGWEDGVKTLPKVWNTLQSNRTEEREYNPEVCMGKDLPMDYWGNATNARVNADSIMVRQPPKGWQYQFLGLQIHTSDGPDKWAAISVARYDYRIPVQTTTQYSLPHGSTYRCRIRWRKNKENAWLYLPAAINQGGEKVCKFSELIHSMKAPFDGEFGGICLQNVKES